MNAATTTIVIFFVGIAAFTDPPAGSNAAKLVIFPATPEGKEYNNVKLSPHTTFLRLYGSQLAVEKPEAYCRNVLKGDWNGELCSVKLAGAQLSAPTSGNFGPHDPSFQKMTRMRAMCDQIREVKPEYVNDTTGDSAAARFEIAGGRMSGCQRPKGAFVAVLTVATANGELILVRKGETLKIPLRNDARVAIVNEPKHTAHAAMLKGEDHFGWYYYIANGDPRCGIKIPQKTDVRQCDGIPGIVEADPPSAGGPDCGTAGYP